ncbi:MAG: DUF2236 domain-containing protein [Actinobacteria bacterium]|nr:DUF2236 domain-containing protein [Actinomycetota bacterium]
MSDRGPVGAESVSGRVRRESVVLLGAGRELLLQVAHPGVGDGDAPYDDAELRWLWATRVETTLLLYTRYVGPLRLADVEAYYAEQRRFLLDCDVAPETVPDTFGAFMRWYDETVEQVLEVTPAAREVAQEILRPRRLPLPLRPAHDALKLATVGLLPPTLRAAYGLGWGPQRERLLAAQTTLVRRVMPLLPALVREAPATRSAA